MCRLGWQISSGAHVTLFHCQFAWSEVSLPDSGGIGGGSIAVVDAARLLDVGSRFVSARAPKGGAIYTESSSAVALVDSHFVLCTAETYG